ncbi:hypothetical protein [Acidisoma sp. 7E03]
MAIICPWCTAVIPGRHSRCPGCGYGGCESAIAPGASLITGYAPRAAGLGHHLLAFIASALCAICFAISLQPGAMLTPATQRAAPHTLDSRLQTSLIQAEAAVRHALNAPDYRGFADAFVQRSAGGLLAICGTIDGSAGSGALAGTRFLSVAGIMTMTRFEATSPDFARLWSRLCTVSARSW